MRLGLDISPRQQPEGRRESGMAIVMTVIMMFSILGMTGMAIDMGVTYMLRGKLSAAVDAAALGAARGLTVSGTAAQQRDSAIQAANDFFNANFPPGLMGSRLVSAGAGCTTLCVAFTSNQAVLTINVRARIDSPTFFMNVFNISSLPLAATGTATRRSINVILVLDRSGSMAPACNSMKQAANIFTEYFSDEFDRLSLISFSDNPAPVYPPRTNWRTATNSSGRTLQQEINAVNCTGITGSIPAMEMAYNQLRNINQPLARNVIVLMTDGMPNGLPAEYPTFSRPDPLTPRYGYLNPNGPPSPPPPTHGYLAPPGPPGTRVCDNPRNTCTGMLRMTATEDEGWTAVTCTTDGTIRTRLSGGGNYNVNENGDVGITNIPIPILNAGSGVYTNVNGTSVAGCGTGSFKRSIASLPDTDYFGNPLVGFRTNNIPNDGLNESTPAMRSLDHYLRTGPYAGKLRADVLGVVTAASVNAMDAQALRIRNDLTYVPIIYTIGYVPNGPIDEELLARMANDGSALDTYPQDTPGLPNGRERGIYRRAATPDQLRQAFAQIASSALRLSN